MGQKADPIIIDSSGALEEAVPIFRGGGIIAFPTETFYGLCVDPFNAEAVKALFRLKGRPPGNPIPLIISDYPMLKRVALEVPPLAEGLIKRFWPGPLTIIFKARPELPSGLTAGTGTIAVRVSGSGVAARLSRALDSPVTATSANPSGRKPPLEAAEVLAYFNGAIDMLIHGGRLPGKKGSTVVDATGEKLVIVREGEIPSSEITA